MRSEACQCIADKGYLTTHENVSRTPDVCDSLCEWLFGLTDDLCKLRRQVFSSDFLLLLPYDRIDLTRRHGNTVLNSISIRQEPLLGSVGFWEVGVVHEVDKPFPWFKTAVDTWNEICEYLDAFGVEKSKTRTESLLWSATSIRLYQTDSAHLKRSLRSLLLWHGPSQGAISSIRPLYVWLKQLADCRAWSICSNEHICYHTTFVSALITIRDADLVALVLYPGHCVPVEMLRYTVALSWLRYITILALHSIKVRAHHVIGKVPACHILEHVFLVHDLAGPVEVLPSL